MKRTHQALSMGFSLLMMILMMTGCSSDESINPQNDGQISDRGFTTVGSGKKINFYGLTDRNELVKYKAGPPALLLSSVTLSGLGPAEHMLAMDFRPSTGILYGVSDSSKIYTIDPVSGIVKAISKVPFQPTIKGSSVGFDFDPKRDMIRLVTDLGQNLNIDPNQGIVAMVDPDLNPFGPAVNAVAFSNIYIPGRGYTMYDIDASRGDLYVQDPTLGSLSLIGSLGLAISKEGGFDIGSHPVGFGLQNQTEVGYAVLFGHALTGGVIGSDNQAIDAYRVYEINLTNGRATYKGRFDRSVIGIAVP
ncbi:MAG: DUF4394 domain-containing protein [Saprospiraceae bacterium]